QNNGEAAYQSVFHVHFHIIPKHDDGSGLAWPFATTQLDPEQGAILAERIRSHLE
ncbi:MAG: HIT domain-containing protein, partial [Candidatus Thermoplasmatota archaeon]|nr:HIT domain-containing protein [Candidatus Thermoplasmatota archaeon]